MSQKTKHDRLSALSNRDGVIAALAIDQRKSLRRMIANAAGCSLDEITDFRLREFKTLVTQALSPHASAVLLDPEYGIEAAAGRAPGCGLLLAYEMDGYENPRPNRMLSLLENLSVQRLAHLGADGVKILLTYTPFDDPEANDAKHALIERIGCECDAVGLPFFLEPVGYHPGGLDVQSREYALLKPEIVIRSMEEFSKPKYRVDILKVEFPVNVRYVTGQCADDDALYSRDEALRHFRTADQAAGLPYIYLSAGAEIGVFLESLRLAAESGARYSGVLCGRATWQYGAAEYARGGPEALSRWLSCGGVENVRRINQSLLQARGWQSISTTA